MADQRKVSVTNIPQMKPPLTMEQPLQAALSVGTIQNFEEDPFLNHSSSTFLDPAQQVILKASESKVRRKKEETRMELEKIQERIDYTLTEYQGAEVVAEETPSEKEIDLHSVQRPEDLYKLLTDVRLRTKYQRQVMVLLLGHEAAIENRERLLQSIHEFFQETQAGSTSQLLEELELEDIDFNQATAELESALRTAQDAGNRLLEIKKDMGQLFSIVKAFPDTKKGRKKLEKALLKAQEEVQSLQTQLQGMQGELEGSKEKCGRLQKQIDSKTTECERLRKTAAQVEQLQKMNTGLQSEVDKTREAAQRAQVESETERQEKLRFEVKEVVKADDGRVQELEAALVTEKEAVELLKAKMDAREGEFQEEKEVLVAEHEAEVQEMRSRYEEQMKSLMEDDIFSDVGSAEEGEMEGGEYEGGEEVDYELEMDEVEDGNGLASKSAVGRLKLEHQQREKKLKDEVNDVKNKSRKTITGLKLQLTEAQNRHLDECNSLRKQIDSLDREKRSRDAEREEKVASLEEARLLLEAQLAEAVRREAEKESQMLHLQRDLEETLTTRLEEAGPEKASRLLQLVNGSAQWSEHPSYPTTPPFPVVPMDEVLYSCEPSTNQLDPPMFPGGTAQSVQSQILGGTPFSEGSQPIQFPGSLDQSVASHDHHLGSPLQGLTSTAHAHPLHMLVQSRLSHHSPQTVTTLSHDHPVVSEWVKACDLVMKFRDSVVDMLCDDVRFDSEVEDLRSIEGATMERDQEVQGQVTQMRFSLTLMLHQMEVSLQESFSKLLGGEEGGENVEGEDEGEIKNLKLAQAQLRKRLRQTEDTHKMELQESKETIANLSNKVDTLRMELASLRHSMTTPTNKSGGTLAMFTRLDYDHNTRQLQTAVNTDQLSPTVYQKVNESMSDYLAIPTQRLAHIGRRRREKDLAEKLVCDVQRELRDSREAERVVHKIKSREKLKQLRFEQRMKELCEKRNSLAQILTTRLGEVEKTMQMTLIKPIYGSSGQAKHQDLITPLPRPIPARTQPLRTHPRTRVNSSAGGRDSGVGMEGGCHPSMRLVSRLVASRQEAHRGDTTAGEPGRVSFQATPLPLRHLDREPFNRDVATRQGRGEKGQGEGEGDWHVELSRPPTQLEGPFSPLMFQAPPAIPRIMELDVTRKRHPDDLLGHRHPADLLGHLLPGRHFKSPTASPTAMQRAVQQSSVVQSKLVAHCNKDFLCSRGPSLSFPRPTSLPPISVPSRINEPLTAS